MLLVTPIIGDDDVNGCCEDLVDSSVLLAATLHISRSHLPSYVHALLLGDWRQSLGLEEVDTGALVSEIRLEATEDEWGVWAEMQDLGVPLDESQNNLVSQ